MAIQLRAGAARVEITPRPGVDLTGFIARTNPSTEVRDPLYVRALAVDDGEREIVLVVCDLIGLPRDFVSDVRTHIARVTAISGPSVMVACTHTHGGPATLMLQDCGQPDPAYLDDLQDWIVRAVQRAQATSQPATLYAGETTAAAGVHNRRSSDDGIDPAVGLLRLDDTHGRTIATVVNYGCHPTTLHWLNRRITADYPGLVTEQLEAATGGVALFFMGAIGDVGPETRGESSLATVGNGVVEAARAALPKLTPVAEPEIITAGELLRLPLLPIPSRRDWLAWRETYRESALAAEAEGSTVQAKMQWAMVHWVERMFEEMQAGQLAPAIDAEVQMIRLGDVALVGAPGELFVALGLQIKEQSGLRRVLVGGFANDNIGYIPTRRAYEEGGYEVMEAYKYYGYPAALAPEAGERIVAVLLDMLRA